MRRRKTKVVWLPVDLSNRLGTAPATGTLDNTSSTIIKTFTGNPLGDLPAAEEIPVLKDFTESDNIASASTSLADIEQSGYRLRRIVGKLVFAVQQVADADPDAVSICHITAGFIIRRVNHQGISVNSIAGQQGISPANVQNIMDPWIWRRSWVLCNNLIQTDPNVQAFQQSNIRYGAGNMDGPHVDAKTARIVGPEERLFLSVVSEGVNGNAQGAPANIILLGDIRVLGSMRSNAGNRRNASR